MNMETINSALAQVLQELGIGEENQNIVQRIVILALILLVAYAAYFLCRKIMTQVVKKIRTTSQSKWSEHLLGGNFVRNVSHLLPPILIDMLIPLAFSQEPALQQFLLRVCWVYIIIISMRLICSFLSSLYDLSSENEHLRNRPLKGVYQMVKLIVICIGCIFIISTLVGKDAFTILAGLGASAAILMLVFKDTIVGLVAGVQLSANDMLRPGDWITMPRQGADGTVTEVTLTTVKVQNFDNTITTIPPYSLVSDSFQNWRGMSESGGRRIKRSINIDMTSVRFCTSAQMDAFEKKGWLKDFEQTEGGDVNLYVFRHYLELYLRHHSKVNKKMTLMVRQLQPTPQGLPLELYFFSATTQWVAYERLQAEIFDHLLAILPVFRLKVFQAPTGKDIRAIN